MSPFSVFISSSIFLFTPSLIEMSAFQIDIPVRSTGIILLGIALYFCWIKDNNISNGSYINIFNLKSISISVICLTASAACYQPIALMFIPGFLLISLFNQDLRLSKIGKVLLLSIIGLIIYFLLWKFLLSIYDIDLIPAGNQYNIVTMGKMAKLQRLIELFKNFIEFIILPKSSMPTFVSIFITLFSALSIYIFIPSKKFPKKLILTSIFMVLLIGLMPTLIFIYKGTFNALRPQALLGMYFPPALLIGVGVEKAKVYDLKIGKYFCIIVFFLIGVQSFQTSSMITHKQAAYEKDIITAQAILSDLIDVAPNPAFITVNILIEKSSSTITRESGTTYTPERSYNSSPSNRWSGITDCHVFDCQPQRVDALLKIVAPPQVTLIIKKLKVDDLNIQGIKDPFRMEELRSWPQKNSIKVLSDNSLVLKVAGANKKLFGSVEKN